MTGWNVQNRTKVVHYRNKGNEETFEFPEERTLMAAVKEIASRKGLTAVNVLVDGEEVSEQEGQQALTTFRSNEVTVVPKNTGSR